MRFADFWIEFADICKEVIIPIFVVFLFPILIGYFNAKKNFYIESLNAMTSFKKFMIILYDEMEKEGLLNTDEPRPKIFKFKSKEENK